jgi:aerobic-type carbon monoxide dehydrogenase small subunit (CoxS/CutS family)
VLPGNSSTFELNVNGRRRRFGAGPADRLLDVLRDRLGLTGTKEGCGRGECGSCTILVNGRPVLSCILPVAAVTGAVETIEGVAEEAIRLREAFADLGAFQCGFCTPGEIVRGIALLRSGLPADDAGLRRAVSGNICRCTGYAGIVRALRQAASAGRDPASSAGRSEGLSTRAAGGD